MRFAKNRRILESSLILCLAFVLGFVLARKYTCLKPGPAVIEVSNECIKKNMRPVQVSSEIYMCRLIEIIR